MARSLAPQAEGAVETMRTLERALAEAKAHWDDATRQAFDQRHIDPIRSLGWKVANDLAELKRELDSALRELPQTAWR